MNLADLLVALDRHGVRLSLTEQCTLKVSALSAPPAEVLEALRTHKAALLEQLRQNTNICASHSSGFVVLPEPLARMVRAASVGGINRSGLLASGLVPNLGEYVLAWAASYAVGGDVEHALKRLWEAHVGWNEA